MVALFSWKWEQKEWRDGLSEAIAMWIRFKIWIPWNQFAQVKVWGRTVADKEIFEEFDFEVLELGSQLPLRKPPNFWPIWAIFDPNDQIAWNQLFPNVAKVPELT